MKNIYINRDSDKDFKLRHNNENLNKFKSILNSRIQIYIVIKYILYNNSLYKIKNRI